MITAGFLPACAALWHRGVLELVLTGWWRDLPGADRWSPVVWFALPAAVITTLAIAAAVTSRPRALAVVLGVAGLVHPSLPIALAPLALVVRTWPDPRALRMPALIAAAVWAAGFLMSPPCRGIAGALPTWAGLLEAWWLTIGLAGGLLLAIDLLFSEGGRRSQLAAAALLLVTGVLAASGATDVPALLGASGAVLWWRMAAGARHVLAYEGTMAGRLGALLLIILVPILAAVRAGASGGTEGLPSTAEVWRALDAAGSPAVVMKTGGRADTATTIWRSGPSEAQQSLIVIPSEPAAAGEYLATSAVYAWSPVARTLAMRGMLVAPLPLPDQPQPLLWRVLQFEGCHPLTSAWAAVGSAATDGQFSGVFPVPEPNRGALLYLTSSRPLDPQPFEWPAASLQGFERRLFDRESSADEAALAEALARDDMPAASLDASRFIARVRIDRRATAPDTLGITLGGVATGAWARLYAAADPGPGRQPSICRSSLGQPITAYAGAPATLALDIFSQHVVGSGWHGFEQIGDDRLRWTAEPSSELLFLAHRPQPLVLRLQAEPGTGDWSTANLHVTLNGQPASCREGVPPCDWMLPEAAMRTGLNMITLHSVTVPAPAPDPRRLGLMVRGAWLSRP